MTLYNKGWSGGGTIDVLKSCPRVLLVDQAFSRNRRDSLWTSFPWNEFRAVKICTFVQLLVAALQRLTDGHKFIERIFYKHFTQ